MREIKFRAWDKNDNKMFLPHSFYLLNGRLDDFGGDKYIFMQYTGLKDKNGKEIYEGDIMGGEDSAFVGIIEYGTLESFTGFASTEDDEYNTYLTYTGIHLVCSDGESDSYIDKIIDLAVIGNIYENPELLKEDL